MKGLYCILASVFFLQLGIACSEADRDLFEGPVGINFRILLLSIWSIPNVKFVFLSK